MNLRPLGKTGLDVSEIGLGAAQIGNRSLPEEQAESVLRTALDAGINFIDTAAMYGVSEERIGRYVSDRQDAFVLATKCGDYQIEEAGTWKSRHRASSVGRDSPSPRASVAFALAN